MLITELISDLDEQNKMFSALTSVPSIRDKASWCLSWITNPNVDFGTRLVAFAAVEGIFFSSSFASIFWLNERGLMPGLSFSNSLVSRDEGLHLQFACTLFKYVKQKPSQTVISQIVREAVELEKRFTCGTSHKYQSVMTLGKYNSS